MSKMKILDRQEQKMRAILFVLAIFILQGAASSSEINVKAVVGVYEKLAPDGTSELMDNMSFSHIHQLVFLH